MVDVRARPLSDPEGVWVEPVSGARTGVLVLAGSSGSVDERRATWLAERGAAAASIRWFGGTGQPPGSVRCRWRRSPPSSTPWPQTSTGSPSPARARVARRRSCSPPATPDRRRDRVRRSTCGVGQRRTGARWRGRSGPIVVDASRGPAAVRPVRRRVGLDGRRTARLRRAVRPEPETSPELADAAAIPVERITGEVVVVAGGDDQVWNSVRYAAEIERRRRAHGLETTVVTHPDAGHRAVLPGEPASGGGMAMARGGSPAADAALGELAWPAIRSALRLGE